MKDRIEAVLEELCGSEFSKLKSESMKVIQKRNIPFPWSGLIVKENHIEIDKDQLPRFSEIAALEGLTLYRSDENKLNRRLRKGKMQIKIGILPFKCQNQFLLVECQGKLYSFNIKQQHLIQFIFDYFQKEGEWPSGREILVGLRMKDIKPILETIPKNELVQYDHFNKNYHLTLYGVFHAKGCEQYMKATDFLGDELQKAIQKKKKKSLQYDKIPVIVPINDNHKKEIISLLIHPWQLGHSLKDNPLIINLPDDDSGTSIILKYTNPISFTRSRFVRDEEVYSTEFVPLSTGSVLRNISHEALISRFDLSFLNENLRKKCSEHFYSEKYDEAIFNACKVIEVTTRKISKLSDSWIGVKLMRKAFSPDNPILKHGNLKSEQESLMHLFSGFIGTFKNPHSHRFMDIKDPLVAFEILAFADHLYRILEKAKEGEVGEKK